MPPKDPFSRAVAARAINSFADHSRGRTDEKLETLEFEAGQTSFLERVQNLLNEGQNNKVLKLLEERIGRADPLGRDEDPELVEAFELAFDAFVKDGDAESLTVLADMMAGITPDSPEVVYAREEASRQKYNKDEEERERHAKLNHPAPRFFGLN